MDRPETIEETAELVTAAGGTGIAMRVDHARSDDVAALAALIDAEHGGLDVLVNDVWGGDGLIAWNTPFWEHDLQAGLGALRNAIDTHVITSWHAAPLLRRRPGALLVEVTDGNDDRYRGNLFYDLAKDGTIRLARAEAAELATSAVTVIALTPGFLARRPCSTTSASPRRRGATASPATATSRPPRRRASLAGPSPTWPPTPTVHAGTGRRCPPGSSPARTASPTSTAARPTGERTTPSM